VRLSADGEVTLDGAPAAPSERDAVRAVAALVEAAVAPLTAGARSMVERARAGGIRTLPALRAELEALLVPLNRGAARRVLGRLVREHLRLGISGPPVTAERGGSALDTVTDAAVNVDALLPTGVDSERAASDTQPDARVDSIPPFPPPPRLGSLMTLPGAVTAVDTEPEGVTVPQAAIADPSALDTQPDRAPPEEPSAPPLAPRVPAKKPVALLAVVAFLLLAGLAFVLLRLRSR
jgi:hypothetical protein